MFKKCTRPLLCFFLPSWVMCALLLGENANSAFEDFVSLLPCFWKHSLSSSQKPRNKKESVFLIQGIPLSVYSVELSASFGTERVQFYEFDSEVRSVQVCWIGAIRHDKVMTPPQGQRGCSCTVSEVTPNLFMTGVNNSGWRTVCVSEVTCNQDLEGLKRSERCPQGVGHHLFWGSVCMCCLIKGTVVVSLNLLHGVFFVVGRSTCFIKTYVFLLFFSIFFLLRILL